MGKHPRDKKKRRTQAERTAETRARLIDATIETLSKEGYSGTSTTEIVRRAGVSRGAQVHHFPTKADLVVAAMKQLNEDRLDEFRTAFAQIPEGVDRGAAALEILWPMFNGTNYTAWIELVVAARTRPELRKKLRDARRDFADKTRDIFGEVFPELADSPRAANLVLMVVFGLLEGLGLEYMVDPRNPQIPAVLAVLKATGGDLLDHVVLSDDPLTEEKTGGNNADADTTLRVARD